MEFGTELDGTQDFFQESHFNKKTYSANTYVQSKKIHKHFEGVISVYERRELRRENAETQKYKNTK